MEGAKEDDESINCSFQPFEVESSAFETTSIFHAICFLHS
jgi:hypothetical protein